MHLRRIIAKRALCLVCAIVSVCSLQAELFLLIGLNTLKRNNGGLYDDSNPRFSFSVYISRTKKIDCVHCERFSFFSVRNQLSRSLKGSFLCTGVLYVCILFCIQMFSMKRFVVLERIEYRHSTLDFVFA